MKTICVYHKRDLDGWMSAAIVRYWFDDNKKDKDEIDFVGYDYGDSLPDLWGYDKIIMCDISFPNEIMKLLYADFSENFIWIDHHISAMNDNKDIPIRGLRVTTFAACELTWHYFFPSKTSAGVNTLPEIVRLLGMYDSFRHKGTHEEKKILEFQYGARQAITNYIEAYDLLLSRIKNPPEIVGDDIHEKGKIIYQYLCSESKQIYSRAFPIELFEEEVWPDGKSKGVINLKPFLCVNQERFNPINFGIDYHKSGYCGFLSFYYDNNVWNFSIYNDDGSTDVSAIAKSFGGGGHKGASGFLIRNIKTFLKKHKIEYGLQHGRNN